MAGSGGIWEETTFFRVHCITLRPDTVRPVTIKKGTELMVLELAPIAHRVNERVGEQWHEEAPDPWDGHVASRMVERVESTLLDSVLLGESLVASPTGGFRVTLGSVLAAARSRLAGQRRPPSLLPVRMGGRLNRAKASP